MTDSKIDSLPVSHCLKGVLDWVEASRIDKHSLCPIVEDLVHFHTRSQNFSCPFLHHYHRCQVMERYWEALNARVVSDDRLTETAGGCAKIKIKKRMSWNNIVRALNTNFFYTTSMFGVAPSYPIRSCHGTRIYDPRLFYIHQACEAKTFLLDLPQVKPKMVFTIYVALNTDAK